MALRIRQAAYETSGMPPRTYQVRADEVRGHLLIIASGGRMDDLMPGFREDPDADPDYQKVTLTIDPLPDVSTPAGRVQQRFLDLVNSASTFDIVGATEDTTWSDGNSTTVEPAFTLGSTVFYAVGVCDGDGRKVIGATGGEPCTPVVGILYHELAHAFHGHPSGNPFDPAVTAHDEAEAVSDENDLREAMGLELRSTTDLRSSCGCSGPGGSGSCCIIASVATGAPYGPEVNALRATRDHFLRATRVGSALFDAIHRDYYSFSIEICRIMVRAPEARAAVERDLVRPLIAILRFLRLHGAGTTSDAAVCAYHEARSLVCELRERDTGLVAVVRGLARGSNVCDVTHAAPSVAQIEGILLARLPDLPHVRWGICGLLALFLDSVDALGPDADAREIATWWRSGLIEWLCAMPVDLSTDLDDPAWARDVRLLLGPAIVDDGDRDAVVRHLTRRRTAA